MKNLIYQYFNSPDKDRVRKDRPGVYVNAGNYHEYSKQSISAYAKKHGVSYKFMDHKLPDDIPLFYGIFLPFLEGWCWDYDNICFIDSDIMATVDSGNVFDYAGKQGLTLHKMDASKQRFDSKRAFQFFNEIEGFFNSGVVIFPRSEYENFIHFVSTLKHRDLHRTSVENSLGGFDQGLLNTWIANHRRYNELPKQYNYHMGRYQKPERWNKGVSLIHYHRHNKPLMETEFNDERILK